MLNGSETKYSLNTSQPLLKIGFYCTFHNAMNFLRPGHNLLASMNTAENDTRHVSVLSYVTWHL